MAESQKHILHPKTTQRLTVWSVALQGGFNYLILTVSMLTAVKFRLMPGVGTPLGIEYQQHFFELYLLLLTATGAAYLLALASQWTGIFAHQLYLTRQFRLLLIALGFADLSILVLMPDVSRLQILYFTAMVMSLGIFLILVPGRIRQHAQQNLSVLDNLHQIREHQYLIQIWASHRIRARYTQTFLGILWIVLFPIMESLVMAFAFSKLLGHGEREGVSWVLFILSGRIAFSIFQKIVMGGQNAIQGMSTIIEQVYFPRELVIVLLSTEVMVDFIFAFAGFVVIALFYGVTPNIYYIFLPIPILLILILSMGLGFIVAWLGLLVRDIQQLVAIGMQLFFYVTVLFDSSRVSSNLQFIPLINPISAMVEAFRSITIHNQMPDFSSLYFPAALSIAVLYTGYVFYKVNEDRFTDYL